MATRRRAPAKPVEQQQPAAPEQAPPRGGAQPVASAAGSVTRVNARMPDIELRVGRVVASVFARAEQVLGDYDRLEDELSLEGAATPEQVRAALNRVERCASDAHLLFMFAQAEFEKFEQESVQYLAVMRDKATRLLQQEKDDGKRSKAITDADVASTMTRLFPDEVPAIERRRTADKHAVKHLESLATRWANRYKSLSSMVNPRG